MNAGQRAMSGLVLLIRPDRYKFFPGETAEDAVCFPAPSFHTGGGVAPFQGFLLLLGRCLLMGFRFVPDGVPDAPSFGCLSR